MKKMISAILAAVLAFASVGAFAEGVTVTLNGEALGFDTEPIIEEGRVLVPMRAIFEALGFTVEWEGDASSALALRSDRAIITAVDKARLLILTDELKAVDTDVPTRLVDGTTLVPVRAVSEGAGCSVDWDGETKTVIINEK